MISMAAKEVCSVHIRRQEPLVGWITATKRATRPAGRAPASRSRTLYWTGPPGAHAVDFGAVGLLETLVSSSRELSLDLAAIDPGLALLARPRC